jgi:GNAT superfamily N-acetyltransferase
MSAGQAFTLDEDQRLHESGPDGEAQVSLWWNHVPALPDERIGVIGGFNATSAIAAAKVLARAEQELRSHGCSLAVGPMDGNTWRHYRFVTDAGSEPPFFLEPANPPEWPAWWRIAGYAPLAEYHSTMVDDLAQRDTRLSGVAVRMAKAGVIIRALDKTRFEDELKRIYEVSAVSFRENYLYTPQTEEAFIAQYRPIQTRAIPELILLAEHEGKPVGYVFAIPDYAQAQRGEPATTVIVKTLAVLPGRSYAGLGALLLADVHEAARQLGFARAIHALMHETNRSRNLSAHYSHTIRRYTLFAKRLL